MIEIFETCAGIHILRECVHFGVGIGKHLVVVRARTDVVVFLRHEDVALNATCDGDVVVFRELYLLCVDRSRRHHASEHERESLVHLFLLLLIVFTC